MIKDFIAGNNRSLWIIALLIVGWLLLYWGKNMDRTRDYLRNPKAGHIYIFKEDNLYAPMRLDSIGESQFFMRNYQFMFADAVPGRDQILDKEFDLNFYAIYQKQEMNRLYNAGNLVQIYPD